MSDRRTEDRESGQTSAWIVTFSDLLALMLTFFVLIFAMSSVKYDAWRALVDALSEQLSASQNWRTPWLPNDKSVGRVFVARAVNLDYLNRVLEDKIAEHPVLTLAVVHRLDDRLILSIPAELLFEAGGARLSESAETAVRDLSDGFKYVANRIEMIGHSDPAPLNASKQFASNWELSLARATALARVFVDSGYDRPINAYGVADARFYDLDKSLAEEVRLRLSRRVDLVVRTGRSEADDDA